MMRTISANGHRFDSALVCRAEGCSRTWGEQQVSPTRCGGEPAIPYPRPAKRQTQNPVLYCYLARIAAGGGHPGYTREEVGGVTGRGATAAPAKRDPSEFELGFGERPIYHN